MRTLWRAVLSAVAVWVAVVTASRLIALASGSGARDGVGEVRFSRWADRDPPLVNRLEEAGRRLAPGEAVLPVCAPVCETSWYSAAAWYAMPRQAVVHAKTAGQLGPVHPTIVERTRTEITIEPRSQQQQRTDGGR